MRSLDQEVRSTGESEMNVMLLSVVLVVVLEVSVALVGVRAPVWLAMMSLCAGGERRTSASS
jgi:hypothetical protein